MAAVLTKKSSGCPKSITPTEADVQLARESIQRLAKYAGKNHDIKAQVIPAGGLGKDKPVVIPESVFRLICDALTQIAQGNAVAMTPIHADLTTQQAAELLNVSRPFLVDLLEKGEIAHRKVGTHRRVQLLDLMAYKQRSDIQRLKAVEELAADAQEQGLGY